MRQSLLEKYKEHLPVTGGTPMFSMGEGATPLVKSRKIAELVGCDELYFKLEGCNPTGSFKDRGMVVAVAKAIEAGGTSLACASTGNTSASAAAYGAYCGLPTTVIVPKGNVSRGKLAQAIAYGARIMLIQGSFDLALQMVRELTERNPIVLVNSVNPNRIQGQKTASFEVVEDLGTAPDYLFIPVGNAGNITAYWLGFKEAYHNEWTSILPMMMGFQAEGAAPIVRGDVVAEPETIASAIRIGNPASWSSAIEARDESGGSIGMVSDDEIMDAYKLMANGEGLFCEPASAAGVAGLLKRSETGLSLEGKRVVCVITGSGLKDPDLANEVEPVWMEEYPPDVSVVEEALKLS
ncbi:MAG: threonine synthase [SAR202 cluster bacterium]|jgi:threonine synthase|nr:threonine synthase [SAR202 cluster bacterium]HAL48359.1 threonine synthase [Dehalococcoidia bacterium]MDP6663665.1 threonine synthase [SAR202 cluster bacterium]MDP6798533.1 threonine synthase [SAR202 cluster bacterium]MQG58307.1 threonine synthase [SAR202 cluster bacterium]|tara:strand:+ start:99 stop:1154 length:1056 start_codon:yes stop_codon:yes gene_type:complete